MNTRMILPWTVLLVLVVPLCAQETFAPSQIARMDAASYLQPLPSDRIVPLKTIAGDFAANETAATGKYSGKRIIVTGRISKLGKGGGENEVFYVTLQDASATLPAVKAKFLSGSIPVNSEIEVSNDGSQAVLVRRDRMGNILARDPYLFLDKRVAIEGDFKELKVGEIVLTACKLVPKEKLRMKKGGR